MNIIITILSYGIEFLKFMVMVEVLGSWIPPFRNSYYYELILKFNRPFLDPVRKMLFRSTQPMMLDLSPVILYLILNLLQRVLWGIL